MYFTWFISLIGLVFIKNIVPSRRLISLEFRAFSMAKKVIIDTNFLVECIRFKIDLFSEIDRLLIYHELFILDRALEELSRIKIKERALLKKFLEKFKIIDTSSYSNLGVDDIITKLSEDYVIATQDKELKRRLKGQKIIIRQKKYLEL